MDKYWEELERKVVLEDDDGASAELEESRRHSKDIERIFRKAFGDVPGLAVRSVDDRSAAVSFDYGGVKILVERVKRGEFTLASPNSGIGGGMNYAVVLQKGDEETRLLRACKELVTIIGG